MRITYIVAPFDSPEYLVRCINSIKRQTFSDNEIVVAENSFCSDGKLAEYLAGTENLRLISDRPKGIAEKIREAVSLASPESGMIKLVSVDTVASPVASAEAQRGGDIIIAGTARKSVDGYEVVENSLFSGIPQLSLYSLFLKKDVFGRLDDGALTQKQLSELWIDEQSVCGASISTTCEICFYTTGSTVLQDADPIGTCMGCKDRILALVKKSLAANSVVMLDKYLSRLLGFLFDGKCGQEQKNAVFGFIKELGGLARCSESSMRLYELYMDGGTEFVQGFDAEGYLLYMGRKNQLARMSFYQASLPEADPVAADTKAIRNNVEALYKSMYFVLGSQPAGNSPNALNNPANQVPEMFADGSLGMTVILKSIKGWLRFKLNRKKKLALSMADVMRRLRHKLSRIR